VRVFVLPVAEYENLVTGGAPRGRKPFFVEACGSPTGLPPCDLAGFMFTEIIHLKI
jgi:hypothetical protein